KFKIFNQNALTSFSEEDRLAILNLFLQDSIGALLKIKESEKSNKIEELLFHIHLLKGTSASIGAEQLHYYIRKIELMIRNGNAPINWIEELDTLYLEV